MPGSQTTPDRRGACDDAPHRVAFRADNGVGVTLVNSTITGNTTRDIQLTFGARVDLQTLTFGTYTCDATVLVRGTSGIVCPH